MGGRTKMYVNASKNQYVQKPACESFTFNFVVSFNKIVKNVFSQIIYFTIFLRTETDLEVYWCFLKHFNFQNSGEITYHDVWLFGTIIIHQVTFKNA